MNTTVTKNVMKEGDGTEGDMSIETPNKQTAPTTRRGPLKVSQTVHVCQPQASDDPLQLSRRSNSAAGDDAPHQRHRWNARWHSEPAVGQRLHPLE